MDELKLPFPRMSIEAKLTELGLTLPEAPAAVAAYQPWIRTGNLVFTSGQLLSATVPLPTPASSATNSPRRTVIRPPANAP